MYSFTSFVGNGDGDGVVHIVASCWGSLAHWAKRDAALCSALAQVPDSKTGPSVGVSFPRYAF
jgi:hypothetical protein